MNSYYYIWKNHANGLIAGFGYNLEKIYTQGFAMIRLQSVDLTVTASATPESLFALTGIVSSPDLYIKKKSGNSGEMYIGDETAQTYPIGTELNIREFISMRGGEPFDFSKIYIKAASNGDGLHVLVTNRP